MIEIKNVKKFFKEEKILDDINLELYDNHIYGFIGRNGSGKTVLFKLICGYLRADCGEITVEGLVLGKEDDFPSSLGVLIEKPGFLWHETAFTNLDYLARIKNEITKEKIMETISLVGLDPCSKKRVGKFSLGMKQRLGIAQAIMEEPDILILDEPMNGLDESGVQQIRNILMEYKKENRVILLASHNKEDIEVLCDEVYCVENGSVRKMD